MTLRGGGERGPAVRVARKGPRWSATDHPYPNPSRMLLARILSTLALLCALAVTALGIWLGDTWNIVLGSILICSAAVSVRTAWRTRRQTHRP